MPKIAISYRRKDSDAITGRIRDRIARQFGDNSVFMDIDNIPLGIDFRKQIQEVLRENQILLVIIGPTDPDGNDFRCTSRYASVAPNTAKIAPDAPTLTLT